MIIGPSLVLLNKYILYDLNFRFPMFLSGLGVLVSAVVARLLVAIGVVDIQQKEAVEGVFWYKRVLPVGLGYALTLALGNYVYLLLDVGFIQMLKSFVPVIIMTTAYLSGTENPNEPVILSVIIISLGTALTCTYTPSINFAGVAVQFIAEVCDAVRLVLTQYLLQNLNFGVIEGQYVLSPASAFWLFLFSFIFEAREMYHTNAILIIRHNIPMFLAAASLGLFVNFLSYFVIQATSSLTLKILGGVRNILTIAVGVVRYSEIVSVLELVGYAITFAGFILYSFASAGWLNGYSIRGKKTTSLQTADNFNRGNVYDPVATEECDGLLRDSNDS